MTKLIIVINGGIVESVYSDIFELEYRIIDLDSRNVGEEYTSNFVQDGTFNNIDEKTEEILKL